MDEAPTASTSLTCKTDGWEGQFGHPRGVGGHLVGWLMARKNAYINALAADVVQREPPGHVLEIGFGPGTLAERLGRAGWRVAGIDVSAVMVAQARRRCRGLADVDLRLGDVAQLPFAAATFDAAVAVNNVHHWRSIPAGLRELRRVVRPGGALVLPLRMRATRPSRFQAPGYDAAGIVVVVAQVAAAGFTTVAREDHRLAREVVVLRAS